MADSTTRPSAATWGAAAAGVVALVAMVAFAVGLPEASGDADEADRSSLPALPDRLAGGWTQLADASAPDDAGADTAAFDEQQRQALAYVNGVLAAVYDEPTEFEAYVDGDGANLVTATIFAAGGGAFAPANGVADPTQYGLVRAPVELSRHGAAVCIANYQTPSLSSGDAEEQPADPTPLTVACQQLHGDVTVQLGSTEMSVDDTVALLDDLSGRLA